MYDVFIRVHVRNGRRRTGGAVFCLLEICLCVTMRGGNDGVHHDSA